MAFEIMSRWVKNCYDHLLLELELAVLKKGLDFGVTPHRVSVVEIVTAMELACRSLVSGDAHVLRSQVAQLLYKRDKEKDQNVT